MNENQMEDWANRWAQELKKLFKTATARLKKSPFLVRNFIDEENKIENLFSNGLRRGRNLKCDSWVKMIETGTFDPILTSVIFSKAKKMPYLNIENNPFHDKSDIFGFIILNLLKSMQLVLHVKATCKSQEVVRDASLRYCELHTEFMNFPKTELHEMAKLTILKPEYLQTKQQILRHLLETHAYDTLIQRFTGIVLPIMLHYQFAIVLTSEYPDYELDYFFNLFKTSTKRQWFNALRNSEFFQNKVFFQSFFEILFLGVH